MANPQPHNPFNGDTFIGPEIRKLIKEFRIQTIIETGTWSAHTTRELAKFGPTVWTIDATFEHLYEEFGHKARDTLKFSGINVVLGDSAIDLKNIIKKVESPMLFYLDAHGGGANDSNVNPLLEELDAISKAMWCKDNCVIVIHDFFVPGKDYGHNGGDWGRGYEPLSLELIKPYLEQTYPKSYRYRYNEQADGACRGVIYVYPI